MKKYILISFLLPFVTIIVSAQNFRILPKDHDLFYLSDKEMIVFHADSVIHQAGDTIYYDHSVVLEKSNLPGNCTFSTNDTNAFGQKIILSGNYGYFFNSDGDTIKIRKNTSVGDTMVIYNYSNGDYILATHIQTTLLPTLAVVDNSKIFVLQKKDSGGNNIQSSWNGKNLFLSQNLGLILQYKWRDFPNDTSAVILVGKEFLPTGAVEGVPDPTAARIFSLEPGNEFHYRILSENCGFIGCITERTEEKRFVIDVDTSANADTLDISYYHVFRTYIDHPLDGLDTIQGIDTIYEKIILSEYAHLDSFPRQLFMWNGEPGFSVTKVTDTTGDRYRKELNLNFTYDTVNECLAPSIPVDTLPKYIYGDGLGLTYFANDTAGISYYEQELVYYQKGIETWGDPFDFTGIGIDEIDENIKIAVYPNPVKDQLYILLDVPINNYSLKLFEYSGREILERNISGNNISLNLSALPAGMYILKVQNNTNSTVQKIIKL